LEELSTSTDFTADTHSEAETFLNAMLTYEFLAYLHFWNAVLRKVNVAQVRLQSSSINFTETHDELTNLQLWIEGKGQTSQWTPSIQAKNSSIFGESK